MGLIVGNIISPFGRGGMAVVGLFIWSAILALNMNFKRKEKLYRQHKYKVPPRTLLYEIKTLPLAALAQTQPEGIFIQIAPGSSIA